MVISSRIPEISSFPSSDLPKSGSGVYPRCAIGKLNLQADGAQLLFIQKDVVLFLFFSPTRFPVVVSTGPIPDLGFPLFQSDRVAVRVPLSSSNFPF